MEIGVMVGGRRREQRGVVILAGVREGERSKGERMRGDKRFWPKRKKKKEREEVVETGGDFCQGKRETWRRSQPRKEEGGAAVGSDEWRRGEEGSLALAELTGREGDRRRVWSGCVRDCERMGGLDSIRLLFFSFFFFIIS